MSEPVRTFVLLGASGDLAGRLLLPALGQLLDVEPARQGLVLVGAGAENWDAERWRSRVSESLAAAEVSPATVAALLAHTRYERCDVTADGALAGLLASCDGPSALYFALPPAVTVAACTALEAAPLPPHTVLVLEKPFGTDPAGAAALNSLLGRLVPEEQVHRVDHFLGRATVLNVLGLRFANRVFEPVWNAAHVASVDIVFDEDLTLENRAGYYDRAGALVDMIQSHLLQVLAVVAMEPPAAVDAVQLREAKSAVLRSCRLWDDDPVTAGRRACYTAGRVGERTVPDYTAEPGVDPERRTETLAEVRVAVDTPRWSGVPFRLRSGKSMGRRRKEVVVTFRATEHLPHGLRGEVEPDRLRLLMGPDGLRQEITVNGPGDPLELDRAVLAADLAAGRLPAYGEVLAGVLDGDPLLAVRGDSAERCWQIVQPVLDAWRADRTPLESYPAGSDGPPGWAPVP